MSRILYFNIQTENVRCFGEGNGIASVQVYGGTLILNSYMHEWSSGQQVETLINVESEFTRLLLQIR